MSNRSRTFSIKAIVLSQKSIGETDRVVRLLSRERGKITVIAKGARKMNSSKRAFLEAGNVIVAHLVKTKSLPLLTQAKLLQDCAPIWTSLDKIRQLSQFLEILDRLFVEEELTPEVFDFILESRNQIVSAEKTKRTIIKRLEALIVHLGYQPLEDTQHSSILDYVSELSDRPMKSWKYLKV